MAQLGGFTAGTVRANSSRDVICIHEVHFDAALHRLNSQLAELNEVVRTRSTSLFVRFGSFVLHSLLLGNQVAVGLQAGRQELGFALSLQGGIQQQPRTQRYTVQAIRVHAHSSASALLGQLANACDAQQRRHHQSIGRCRGTWDVVHLEADLGERHAHHGTQQDVPGTHQSPQMRHLLGFGGAARAAHSLRAGHRRVGAVRQYYVLGDDGGDCGLVTLLGGGILLLQLGEGGLTQQALDSLEGVVQHGLIARGVHGFGVRAEDPQGHSQRL
mmetsp:Transcript_3993/g.5968  ORF Transcript_3993/g.5968 Transcript_3993/m.5968 type:complete len:272 (-) Transcript_3993:1360-2175(-)